MCGIFGIKRMGQNGADRINTWQIGVLALEMQKRGIDAAGVCLQRRDGSLQWHKQPLPAWSFLKSQPYLQWLKQQGADDKGDLPDDVVTVIGHTRAWTKGLPSNPANNHPLVDFDDPDVVLVHNGGVWNDDQLFQEMHLKRVGEVDSDILRAILDRHGLNADGIKALQKARGAIAIAAVSQKQPDLLLLTRSGSPLEIGMLENSHQLIFASTKDAIHQVSRTWEKKWGLHWRINRSDLKFCPVEHSAWFLFNNQGMQQTGPFDTYQQSNRNIIYNVHRDYQHKHKRIKAESNKQIVKQIKAQAPTKQEGLLPEVVQCKKCQKFCKLTPDERKLALWELECGTCGELLGWTK